MRQHTSKQPWYNQVFGLCVYTTWDKPQFVSFPASFLYIGGFGDFGNLLVPTLRGASWDIGTVYGY